MGNDGDTYIVNVYYTGFEILTTLRNIIDKNIPIRNMYGFISYLREENNIYFLVNSLSVTENITSAYYTKKPVITFGDTFNDIVDTIIKLYLPDIIKTICDVKDMETFREIIKYIPLQAQELFLESAYIAQEEKSQTNIEIRDMIINYFYDYVVFIENSWVSSLLEKTEGILRCYDTTKKTKEKWVDCPPKIKIGLSVHRTAKMERARQNQYGYYGTIDNRKQVFRIIDLKEESRNIQKKLETKDIYDHNLIRTGIRCGTGAMKKAKLIDMLRF